jgi:hypothetical protein
MLFPFKVSVTLFTSGAGRIPFQAGLVKVFSGLFHEEVEGVYIYLCIWTGAASRTGGKGGFFNRVHGRIYLRACEMKDAGRSQFLLQ